MSRRTSVLVLHAVAAGAVSLTSGWIGSGIILCLVAPVLLVRFVWLDEERTMTGAMGATAVLAMMANSANGVAGAVTVALGGYIAAEIAAHGARVRRAAPLPRLAGDLVPMLLVAAMAAATTLGTVAVVRLGVPPTVSVAGALVLAAGVSAVAVGRADRPPGEPESPLLSRGIEPSRDVQVPPR